MALASHGKTSQYRKPVSINDRPAQREIYAQRVDKNTPVGTARRSSLSSGRQDHSASRLELNLRPLFREHYRLHTGNIEPFPAAHVLACHHVVFAQHVRPGLGEAGTVTLVGAAGKLAFLGADHPGHFVLRRLVAVRTIQRSRFFLLLLVKKIALSHKFGVPASGFPPTMNYCTFDDGIDS